MLNLDLNLLRTFDALMEQRSVTKAAAGLSVTQSAVSHALGRLRSALDDPLFVRGGGMLHPTAKAEAIADGIRQGLAHFEEALSSASFDPARANRSFTLAASTYFSSELIPALIAELRRTAPGISLKLVPVTEMLMPMLDRGEVDLALGAAIETPARFVVEHLYRERFVWIAAKDHPWAGRKVTSGQITRASRVSVVTSGPFSAASQALNAIGLIPSPAAGPGETSSANDRQTIVYDAQTSVAIVARSDLIARVPQRTAEEAVRAGKVTILETALESPIASIVMLWHVRQQSAQDLSWLRSKVREVIS